MTPSSTVSNERGRIVVTGATGFVGQALIERIRLQERWNITAFTRRDHPFPTGIQVHKTNLSPKADHGDKLRGSDIVVHLAARVHVKRDQTRDSLASFRETNVDGTISLAQQAVRAGVRRFIFLSTVKVHGETTQPGRPFVETDPPAPSDPYAISKMEAEAGLLTIGSEGGMECVIIRPPLVYGRGVKANFQSLARLVSTGLPLPFGALSSNRRSLINLDNLTDLILTCALNPKAANQVFLASDDHDLSTAELVRKMSKAIDVRPRLFSVPRRVLEVAAGLAGGAAVVERLCGSLQVDISKAKDVLGWTPLASVDDGLQKAMETVRPPAI